MDIDGLDAKINELKKKAELASLNRLKAQAAKESAEQERVAILMELKEKYGIDSVEQAREVLGEKKKAFEDLLRRAEEDLKYA